YSCLSVYSSADRCDKLCLLSMMNTSENARMALNSAPLRVPSTRQDAAIYAQDCHCTRRVLAPLPRIMGFLGSATSTKTILSDAVRQLRKGDSKANNSPQITRGMAQIIADRPRACQGGNAQAL
ncbi:hypothetical protein UF36_00005, partial [Vibrio parahaemolyticus]